MAKYKRTMAQHLRQLRAAEKEEVEVRRILIEQGFVNVIHDEWVRIKG